MKLKQYESYSIMLAKTQAKVTKSDSASLIITLSIWLPVLYVVYINYYQRLSIKANTLQQMKSLAEIC